ncbi:hypothetical protein B0T19DRAFT_115739 [Cercophora scortea]|uniref:Uncharacterized protein n=1 Tax=Cercophora scortea TaxID=314031 RepID=A0AAE0IYV4_9PEZI|nr:hypothetical protein B0T19DRAFT_115739 [Cercophora scortea]
MAMNSPSNSVWGSRPTLPSVTFVHRQCIPCRRHANSSFIAVGDFTLPRTACRTIIGLNPGYPTDCTSCMLRRKPCDRVPAVMEGDARDLNLALDWASNFFTRPDGSIGTDSEKEIRKQVATAMADLDSAFLVAVQEFTVANSTDRAGPLPEIAAQSAASAAHRRNKFVRDRRLLFATKFPRPSFTNLPHGTDAQSPEMREAAIQKAKNDWKLAQYMRLLYGDPGEEAWTLGKKRFVDAMVRIVNEIKDVRVEGDGTNERVQLENMFPSFPSGFNDDWE